MTSISDTNVVNAPGGLVELGSIVNTSVSTVTISANPEASAQNIIGPITIVSDGSPLMIDFFVPFIRTPSQAGAFTYFNLYIDGASAGRWGRFWTGSAIGEIDQPVNLSRRITLSAGVHTIEVRAWRNGNNSSISYGPGTGDGGDNPMYLRVSKIIQASQLIVQTPNAPLVTSLPSNAIDGQEVRYLADNTNGIIWNFRYRAGSSSAYKWEFIGGTPMVANQGTGGQTSSNNYQTSNIPQITVPLAGDYSVGFGGYCQKATGNAGVAGMVFGLHLNGTEKYIVEEDATTIYDGGNPWSQVVVTGASVSQVFDVRYKVTTSLNSAFGNIRFSITPIRVSA